MTNSIKDDANSIMMALQVQDITSQQIAAVNHLLETIQGKLTAILSKFQHNGISDIAIEANAYQEKTNVTSLHRQVAFDPDAVDALTNRATRQDDVDQLIN
jgi:chemotaxis regulatin CheY-phosphate phosphatase CheZ